MHNLHKLCRCKWCDTVRCAQSSLVAHGMARFQKCGVQCASRGQFPLPGIEGWISEGYVFTCTVPFTCVYFRLIDQLLSLLIRFLAII